MKTVIFAAIAAAAAVSLVDPGVRLQLGRTGPAGQPENRARPQTRDSSETGQNVHTWADTTLDQTDASLTDQHAREAIRFIAGQRQGGIVGGDQLAGVLRLVIFHRQAQ